MISHYAPSPHLIYGEHVAERLVIYLDTNVWIDLAQERSDLARNVKELAQATQASRRAIFPISYPAASELLKQHVTTMSRRQAELMDVLSECVSFRAVHHIRELEVLRVYEYLMDGAPRDRRAEVFTATASFAGDGSIVYPEGWTEETAAAWTDFMRRKLPGLLWLQEHLPRADFGERHADVDEEWVKAVTALDEQALQRFTHADGRPSARKLRLEEYAYVLNKYIVKVMPRRVGPAATFLAMEKGAQRVGRGGPTALARIVRLMPSIWLSCEMHVQRRLSQKRATRPQDLYDHEHASVGIPYSDAFVTSDGELLELVRKCHVEEKYTCKLVRGVAELRDYLERIL